METLGPINLAVLIIEGGLLTQVQTHAMETLRPINLAVLIIEGGLLTQVQTHAMGAH